jgi:hypothetical protein
MALISRRPQGELDRFSNHATKPDRGVDAFFNGNPVLGRDLRGECIRDRNNQPIMNLVP